MTGFGAAECEVERGRVRVEVRTVNHRFLNLQVKAPTSLDRQLPLVERLLRGAFSRGHVSVTLSVERSTVEDEAGRELPVDMARARGILFALRSIQDELGVPGELSISDLARFREIFQPTEDPASRRVEVEDTVLEGVVSAALSAVAEMRSEEGRRLGTDLEERLERMSEAVDEIAGRAPQRLVRERDRLVGQIEALLPDGVPVDPDRIAREVAHMADRWDIHEELVRFRSHVAMFRGTLRDGSPDGVGKRLGFIAQEMLREANTMGSKANDAEIMGFVVVLKEELERLREQLENVE
jgi:uncharacterized protein (TIGR00255 family)